jgi:cytochrome b involved in lipid metabolism
LCVIIDNKVYKTTNFAKIHPGGDHLIKLVNGTDASDVFRAMHKKELVEKRLKVLFYSDFDDASILKDENKKEEYLRNK